MRALESTLWTAWSEQRDAAAFGRLVHPALPHAVAVARRLGCSLPDADDAVQDALLRLATWRGASPLEHGIRAWLCREVRTRARSRLRSDRRRLRREAAWARRAERAGRPPPPTEVRDAVERALTSLGRSDREAIELRYLHDMEYRDLAWVMGTSEGACRQRVHRALTRLRGLLGTNASALVAALPLPAVGEASVWVGGAAAHATTASAAGLGGAVMATTGKNLILVGAIAAATGVAGTLGVQSAIRAGHAPAGAGGRETAELLAERDEEIERLRARLDDRAPELRGSDQGAPWPEAPSKRQSDASPDSRSIEKLAAAWRRALTQKSDPKKADQVWSDLLAALRGDDRVALLAALHTLRFTSHLDLDREGVKERLRDHADASEAQTRAWAWMALIALEIRAGTNSVDVAGLRREVSRTPSAFLAVMLVHLVQVSGSIVEGDDADLVLHLWEEPKTRAEVIRGLAGARLLAPSVLERVLGFARSGAEGLKQVCRQVVPGLDDERGIVRDFLLEQVDSGRTAPLEALRRRGVQPPEEAALIGERLRTAFDASSDVAFRRAVVNAVGAVADFSAREWLEGLRENDADPGLRFGAEVALRSLTRTARGQSNRRR